MESRTITVTNASCKYGNLNLRECGREFFPDDVFGPSCRTTGVGHEITLDLDGLPSPIQTDIPIDKRTGKPRWLFRERAPVKYFVRLHQLEPGQKAVIQRLEKRTYKVIPMKYPSSLTNSTLEQTDLLKKDLPETRLISRRTNSIMSNMSPFTIEPETKNHRSRKAGNPNLFDPPEHSDTKAQSHKRPRKRANDLNGARWLSNSISVWSDIRKTMAEQELKHPAMFPSMLVERFIESLTTRKHKVVFDPFMGSGSTLVAARKMRKVGIGLELNPDYVALAKDRLDDLFNKSSHEAEYFIHKADAHKLLEYVEPNSVDITITSPPYWNILNQQRTADSKAIRNYGNLDSDIGTIGDYRTFIDCLQEIFEQVHVAMKPERYCVVVVMDLRKKDKFFPFHSDVAEMMQKIGFIYDDLIIWNRQAEYNNLRPLGYPSVFRVNKVHEFCLIFKTVNRREKVTRDREILGK